MRYVFVHLHFAAIPGASDSSCAADFGTNAHRLAHFQLFVADIVAVVDIGADAGLVAEVFVRQTVVSGKSVATGLHCVLDAYISVYFVDALEPMTSHIRQTAASVMWEQQATEVAEWRLDVDGIERSTMASHHVIRTDCCYSLRCYHSLESAMGRFCVAQIEHKLAHYYLESI